MSPIYAARASVLTCILLAFGGQACAQAGASTDARECINRVFPPPQVGIVDKDAATAEPYCLRALKFEATLSLDEISGVLNALGNLRLFQGKYDQALAVFAEGISENAKDPRWYVGKCLALQLKKELDAAVTECTKAIEVDQNDARAYEVRGRIYLLLKQKDLHDNDEMEWRRLMGIPLH